jgi:hypothetical protein
MAQMVLIMGESGTGKSTSLRNCDPATTAVVNPVGKPLPFKNHFELLNNVTDASKITQYMKEQAASGKKLLVVDDFQYILAVPYMNRIKETGWDKYNDFGANYFEIIDVCKNLPDDVVVAYMTHLETLDNGLTTVKLIGKLLREKITIEGLFTVVLRTGVNEGKYYFYTQNSGKDTVKSPLGMFPAYAIDNDLNYVADKMRNFYEVGEYKSDAEMEQADEQVASDLAKPDANGRRARGNRGTTENTTPANGRKSRTQVETENAEKMADYQKKVDEAIDKVANGRTEVPFEEACKAADSVPKPELETLPRRTRAERHAEQSGNFQDNTDSCSVTLKEDAYFYVPATDNYVKKHEGESVDLIVDGVEVMKQITREEFNQGIKKIAQSGNIPDGCDEAPLPINPPETPTSGRTVRQRKNRETAPGDNQPEQNTSEPAPTGRQRRTRSAR